MATASSSTSAPSTTARKSTSKSSSKPATKSTSKSTNTPATKSPGRSSAKAASRPTTSRRTTPAADSATSALQVLKDDHRSVERLFAQFEQLGERAHKAQQDIVERVVRDLSMHASIEETVFYPAVRAALDKDDLVLEALEEHHLVKLSLAELDSMPPTAERYVAKMTVLMEMVRHHVDEEEDDLFPKVRDAMTRTELEQLGTALLEAKRSAPTKPHPHSPDTPPANVLVSAVTTPIDTARSVGEAAIRKVRQTLRS